MWVWIKKRIIIKWTCSNGPHFALTPAQYWLIVILDVPSALMELLVNNLYWVISETAGQQGFFYNASRNESVYIIGNWNHWMKVKILLCNNEYLHSSIITDEQFVIPKVLILCFYNFSESWRCHAPNLKWHITKNVLSALPNKHFCCTLYGEIFSSTWLIY